MPSGEPRPVPELLERDAELERLTDLARLAAAGNGRLVVVEGEAGVGRSALLGALRDALADTHRVLLARGSELEREHAFGLVGQLLGSVSEAAGGGGTGPAELAASALRAGGDAGERPAFAVLHAFYWLVSSLAEDAPLVLCVDDAHCSDPDSLRFVEYLALRLEGLRVLIVLTRTRTANTPDLERLGARSETERVRLEPLSPAGTSRLLRRWL